MMGSVFVATAQAFVASTNIPLAAARGDAPGVVNAMSNFMGAYNSYATNGFGLGPYYNAAKSAQDSMFINMANLVNGLYP